MDRKTRYVRPAVSVAVTYGVAASAWILLTDVSAGVISGVPKSVIAVSVSKGLFFVLATGLGLYYLVRAQFLRMEAAEMYRRRGERLQRIGEVAAGITREFDSILLTCRTYANVVERHTHDPATREAVTHIFGAIRRGEILTREVLTFAQSSTPVMAPVMLASFIPKVVGDIRPATGNVRIESDVESPTLAARGDADLLERALHNVITNACEATDGAGTVTVSARVPKSLPAHLAPVFRNRKDLIEIAVIDTGGGIPADIIGRMFEPMVTTKRNGTGLGLAIVQRIAHAHDGAVTAENRPGEGATVSLLIPAWRDEDGRDADGSFLPSS